MELSPIVMGVLLGGLYALIATGLSLIFGVMKLINVAHGDLILLSTYIAYAFLTKWGFDPILSLTIIVPSLFFIGYFMQRLLFERVIFKSAEVPLIIAFGISLILQNFHQILWSPMSRGLTTSYILKSFQIGEIFVPLAYLLDFVCAATTLILLHIFLTKTYLGRAIRASSQDSRAAELMGINTKRVYAIAFGISMVTAAIAGVFLGLTFPFTPQSGVSFLIIAFGVVIIGGLGSLIGTFIGGIILGLAQTLGGHFLSNAAQMLVVYTMVIVVLAIRPQGIFGVK